MGAWPRVERFLDAQRYQVSDPNVRLAARGLLADPDKI